MMAISTEDGEPNDLDNPCNLVVNDFTESINHQSQTPRTPTHKLILKTSPTQGTSIGCLSTPKNHASVVDLKLSPENSKNHLFNENFPAVMQCAHCRLIVGDSFSIILRRNDSLTLRTRSEGVQLEGSLHTSLAEEDFGSTYHFLRCNQCSSALGRMYRTTSADLDSLRGFYTFNLEALTFYSLPNIPQSVLQKEPSPSETKPNSSVVVTESNLSKEFEDLKENIVRLQKFCIYLFERLEKIENYSIPNLPTSSPVIELPMNDPSASKAKRPRAQSKTKMLELPGELMAHSTLNDSSSTENETGTTTLESNLSQNNNATLKKMPVSGLNGIKNDPAYTSISNLNLEMRKLIKARKKIELLNAKTVSKSQGTESIDKDTMTSPANSLPFPSQDPNSANSTEKCSKPLTPVRGRKPKIFKKCNLNLDLEDEADFVFKPSPSLLASSANKTISRYEAVTQNFITSTTRGANSGPSEQHDTISKSQDPGVSQKINHHKGNDTSLVNSMDDVYSLSQPSTNSELVVDGFSYPSLANFSTKFELQSKAPKPLETVKKRGRPKKCNTVFGNSNLLSDPVTTLPSR